MKVQCMLCDKIEIIDDHSLLAKRYRNHPLKTHLCQSCYERIKVKTLSRKAARKKRNSGSGH